MLDGFQLVAIVKRSSQASLLRIPLHQRLQDSLAESWQQQYDAFMAEIDEVDFDAGYIPEAHERFRLSNYEFPDWLKEESSETIAQLDPVSDHEDAMDAIKALAAFAQDDGEEIVLFQNFSRARVIQPGRFLFLSGGTYVTRTRPAITLDSKLAAVYLPGDEKLLFHSFRTTNTFLPLAHFYREVTKDEIREILSHSRFAPTDVDAIAGKTSTQWFRKRFAMLRDSGVLDAYTAEEILAHSQGYDVDIQLDDGRIVFPTDKPAAKRLLQYLNEELFRGAITETLYETNSKREADR